MIKLVIGVANSFLINLYNSIWEMGNKNSSSETTTYFYNLIKGVRSCKI